MPGSSGSQRAKRVLASQGKDWGFFSIAVRNRDELCPVDIARHACVGTVPELR